MNFTKNNVLCSYKLPMTHLPPGLTFSLGIVLDMSAGLIMAGTPPRKDTALLTSLKLLFSFFSNSLNSSDGESGPVGK